MKLSNPVIALPVAVFLTGCTPQPKAATDFVTDFCQARLGNMYNAALGSESIESSVSKSADLLTQMGYSLSEYYPAVNNPKEMYIRSEIAWITGWKYDLASRQEAIPKSDLKEYINQWESNCRDKTKAIYMHNTKAG